MEGMAKSRRVAELEQSGKKQEVDLDSWLPTVLATVVERDHPHRQAHSRWAGSCVQRRRRL